MSERSVLHTQEVEGPVSDWELDNALTYVREHCKTESDEPMELDRNFLRVLFDTAREEKLSLEEEVRRPVILPLHVARVVSRVIWQTRGEERPRYEGYKRGVMKIFSDRSARSPSAQAKKMASAAATRRTGKKKKRAYPINKKGQFIMF